MSIITVITALGVVVAILANTTAILRFFHERREKARRLAGVAVAGEASGEPAVPATTGRAGAPRHPAAGAARADDEGIEADAITPSPLPLPLTSFIGREAVVERLVALLGSATTRLVTVLGPGGIGKSRLALETGQRLREQFPDGVVFVPLDSVRDPTLLTATIAGELGMREAGPAVEGKLHAAFTGRRMLLILDNFESLATSAPFLSDLLVSCPGLKILVTSRAILHLAGEIPFPVPPMELPPGDETVGPEKALDYGAVALFVERARAAFPAFELDADNVDDVITICRRLDGLPLAIELAAARLRALSVVQLRERMSKRLPLLTGGPRDAPERQRTLDATIAWSYSLLSPPLRRLFARLAVFDGTTELTIVEAVLGTGDDLIDGLLSLSDHSLVTRFGNSDQTQLMMLETVREYALARLRDDPEADELRAKHASAFLELARHAPDELRSERQEAFAARLQRNAGNLRLAMRWLIEHGPAEDALRMAAALQPFWLRRGSLAEGRRLLERALDAGTGAPPDLRAPALAAVAVLAWRQGDLDAAEPRIEEALVTFRRAGDRERECDGVRGLGIIAQNRGLYDRAETLLTDSLAIAKGLNDRERTANTLLSLGNVHLDRGHVEEAEAAYRASFELSTVVRDALGCAQAVDNLGVAAWYRGDLEKADQLSVQALERYEQLGHRSGIANVLHRQGLLAFERRDLDAAEALWSRSLKIRRAHGERRASAFVLYDLGRAAVQRHDLTEARTRLREALALARLQGSATLEVLCTEGAGSLLAAEGREEEAFELLAAVRHWRARLGMPVAPVNRRRQERLMRRLERSLEGVRLAFLKARAAATEPHDAITHAEAALAPEYTLPSV